MKNPQIVYIGIDVSKESLSIDGESLFAGEVPNQVTQIRSTLKKLQKKAGEGTSLHVCLESTGPYGELLTGECHKAGIRVSVVNPAKVRYYAKAISETAKTDPIDARVIRCFAETRQPQPTPPPNATEVKLRKLVLVREALTKSVTQLQGTFESVAVSEAAKPLKQSIDYLKKKIMKIDKLIQQTIKEDKRLDGLSTALCAIKGVGEITAAITLAYVPEIGTLGRRQAGALSGLAPYTRDSGKFKGKTFISGGRPQVRRALFMPATVARTHNPILKEVYVRLRAKGKPYKVAMTAVMRKLFCYMDSVAAAWLAQDNASAQVAPSTTI